MINKLTNVVSLVAIVTAAALVTAGSSSAATAPSGTVATAAAATQTGMTYQQFLADMNNGSATGGSEVAESSSQAYAAAATSQSVDWASGMTLAQATGMQPLSKSQLATLAAANGASLATLSAATTCMYDKRYWQWGTYPEQRVVYDNTHRCYTGSIITYRATSVTQGATLCNNDGVQTARVDGGTGEGYVIWNDIGYFDCPFILYVISYHHTETMQMEAAGGGGYWIRSVSSNTA